MSKLVLILRPEPGAEESAARARALGLEPIAAPIFTLRSLDWQKPDPGGFDAVLLTSANAARLGGPGMAPFLHLPCYAVGEATAAAASAAGFAQVHTGPADGAAALAMLAADGKRRALHLCGRDPIALDDPAILVTRRPVYAAEAAEALPSAAIDAMRDGALVLLHSPRGAALFSCLSPDRSGVRLAAISAATAEAAGGGWASVSVAPAPRDEALLELAARLCQTDGPGTMEG